MAGSQSFSKRVLVPFGVMALTVGGLSVMGVSLWRMGESPASASSSGTAQSNAGSAVVTANGYLPVNVFNGSEVPGLARKAASHLQETNWTVNTIGNWSGPKVAQSTVFYPIGAKDSALALATQLGVQLKGTTSTMSQTELTYVIAQ